MRYDSNDILTPFGLTVAPVNWSRLRAQLALLIFAVALPLCSCTEVPSNDGSFPVRDSGADADADSDSDSDSDAFVATVCEDNCVYVRAGDSGNGSSWSNALGDLPASLERGYIYLVAAGTYSPLDIDAPASGTESIRLVRATVLDHGDDAGWDDSYAASEALFGPLAISAPFISFEGRGAVRCEGAYQGNAVSISGDDVTVSGIDVDGNFQLDAGYHSDGACTGLSITGDRVRFENSDIHDAADDGVSLNGADQLVFKGNLVHMLHGCGTDGGCGPCYNGHSDGIEMYDVTNAVLDGNFVYDMTSTAALFMGGWADELGDGRSDYCENIRMINNIFYSYETGLAGYFQDVIGLEFYNNVVWGLRQGSYGGLAVGPNVEDLWMYNNVILSMNTAHMGVSFDASEHHSDYNLFAHDTGQWTMGSNSSIAIDPLFASIPDANGAEVDAPEASAFAPQAGSPMLGVGTPGDSTVVIPEHDLFGQVRGTPPALGAIE